MRITEEILMEMGFIKDQLSDELYYVLPNNHRINLHYLEETDEFWVNFNYEPPGFPLKNLSSLLDYTHKNAVRFGENKKIFEIKTALKIE